jgi:hypothetical protein
MAHSRTSKQDGRPAFQFYPDKWYGDKGLRMCSLAARGLWMDMLCIMWESPERGTLREANGKQIIANGLAKLVGADEADTKQYLSELEGHGVFSTLDDGTIYNRYMHGKWELSRTRAEAGRKGGMASKTEAKVPSPSSSPSSSPTPEAENKQQQTPRTRKKRGEPDPRVKVFIDWFYEEFKKRTGRAYVVCGAKDGATVKRLLVSLGKTHKVPLDGLAMAAQRMFEDEWGCASASIGVLSSQINRWLNPDSAVKSRKTNYERELDAASKRVEELWRKRDEESNNRDSVPGVDSVLGVGRRVHSEPRPLGQVHPRGLCGDHAGIPGAPHAGSAGVPAGMRPIGAGCGDDRGTLAGRDDAQAPAKPVAGTPQVLQGASVGSGSLGCVPGRVGTSDEHGQGNVAQGA